MPWSLWLMMQPCSFDAVMRAGVSGAGTMTVGGGSGDNADPMGAILDNDGRHPLGPPWRS